MTSDEALVLLRGESSLDPRIRTSCADSLYKEIVRLKGIIGRNKTTFESLQSEVLKARKDRNIYKIRAEAEPESKFPDWLTKGLAEARGVKK